MSDMVLRKLLLVLRRGKPRITGGPTYYRCSLPFIEYPHSFAIGFGHTAKEAYGHWSVARDLELGCEHTAGVPA